NCLRGQVNGHKGPCTSPCPPPIWVPVLANEFCRIFRHSALYLRLYFVGCHCFGLYWSRPGWLGARVWPCSLRVGQNRMLGLGFGLLFVLNAGTFLCLQ